MKKTAIVFGEVIIILTLLFSFGMSWGDITPPTKNKIFSKESAPSLAPMLEKVMPSVISINIEGSTVVHTSRLPNQFQPFFGDNSPFCQGNSPFRNSPFCRSNPNSNSTSEKFRALGSGVIINAEKGYAVTNNHVVEHANKIQVQLSDGRRYEAQIIGKDPRSDIALIQLKNANNLREIKIADSDSLRVGDYTVAIGNPYGLGETVTSGIISALGRSGLNIEHYENFIQTDAAINRGNSGGALVNLNGELIGINTAILAPDGGNIGIGFAIPGNIVKNLTAQMAQFGQVRRGELGIIGMELNSDLAQIMKINAQKGAFVSQVLPNSSAFEAGIKAGDIIISLNKKPIYSFAALRAEVGSLPVTTKMELGIFREGKIKNIIVELKYSLKHNLNSENRYIGIEGIDLSNYLSDREKGIKVESVKSNTLAAKIGFKKDDIIIGVNQQLVVNIEELKKILDAKPKILVFSVKRGSDNIYLVSE
ncbi:serine endoprotease DegP [Buchnera aphidicola]|uniref:Probable periplasmic serine endoprotease DegP-like n=1 Tax=Buchnera aphidicola str. USDA (Myzus persicae) TaxID=1009856 RepID=W0P512_BUCMP|nr:serine endoprotease DegP [Buchnera aphidicola]AHG60148.1 Htra [Buchnera aphidicola str. USDA (Myzus persicae)]AHG60728.1 Htra [Buchnera aphidicola str. W106 (Myzus persicae)]AHG61300.1 Htra [Buchnera aphidicola str. G002 (Myzus persicae)]AHG61873.1 Htra [Buchnera aphidicola str. F009 (Myzus persicae)]WAI03163.1 MAG: serine endoprotease DegP [Buchnera aphidicola (Myzus persicae)]